MIDRFGKEIDFSELFMEETLSAKDKKELPDSMYGLVYTDDKGNKIRKFPLNDESHVRQAAIFFDRAKDLTEDQKRELARNIVRRAKELDMDYSGWESLKPYLDKAVKESYELDPDFTSGTSDFDEYINDDEYYGEADQALMNQIQKKEDNIPLFQLRTYAKNHLSKRSVAGTIELVFKIGREYTGNNNFEKRCHGYFLNLLREIDSCIKKSGDRISAVKKPKWFFYERKIKQLFNLIDVGYAKDRTLSYISGNRGIISFNEKESIKYTYDPNTDILIHRSRNPNINMLIPSHESRDGIVYPRPRIYCYLEQRANFRLGAQDNGQYGDNVYEIVIPKSITVFRDMEYGKPHDNSKYAKEVFINTNVPLKAKPLTSDNTVNNQINQQQTGSQNMSPPPIKESFEEMFGPVIQEAFDAVTGEEIPIEHAYTMEEMKERTFSESELKHIKHNDEMKHVNKIFFDECYFSSPIDYGKSITLDGPLFVTPYKAIASLFCGRDKVSENIPKIGPCNLGYKEWTDVKAHGANNKPLNKPLREVHVYVEGFPFLESKTIEAEGFIHCINAKTYSDNFYKYPWMAKDDREYLIANTDGNKVEFTKTIKCKVRYIIEGRPARPGQDGLGPRPNGLTHWIHEIANKIHAKYKADQKEPTGNQNCLLCSWCAEAQMRGQDYLPRPIYSPRDSALEIEPESMITGIKRVNLKGGYQSLLSHLKSAKEPFTRWYCHVQWSNSNGGHEFLIVKIDDNSFEIMDAQQGTVKPLNADDYHVKDIDWNESYICRIDDKPFKYMKLDQINDPKKTLPWDPKKDIPYMVKHGLCTKEEAEKELKKMETNLFNSELKKALHQTPIQESHTDLLDEIFYRFEYDGEGIYEALHKKMTMDEWKKFKSSSAATWLPVPPNYQTGDQSFFTEKGYDKFMNLTYPYMTKYLKKSKIRKFETELNPKYIRYRDEYQVVFNKTKTFQESTIQEGVWGDIRNGVNPWSMKRVFHISPEGHLDGQIFKPRVPEYLDKYDPSKTEFEDVETPRVCFSPSIEGCLNAIIVNIGRWKTANKLGDWYVYVPEKPLKEYKYRTTRQLVDEKKVYDANLTKEIWIEEPVRLKQYGIIRIDSVTDANRKKAVPTTLGESKKRNVYNFKWHWLVKPKVLRDVPYDYSPKSVCEDMVSDLSRFKYGLGYNGSIHHGSSKDFDEKYRLESPEEFEKNGGGICYDYVEFMEGYLDAFGYTCRKFYISTDTKDMDTHTFILVDDGKGGFIYPEAAFKPMEGVYEVKSPEEAALKVMDHIFDINDNDKKYDEIKYYVWEYKGHPPYGSDMETCHKYFTKGEPFHEGTAKKLKRKE